MQVFFHKRGIYHYLKPFPKISIGILCLLCGSRILLNKPRQELGIVDFAAVYFLSKYKLVQLLTYLLLRRKTLLHTCFPTLRSVQIPHDRCHIPREIHLPRIHQTLIHSLQPTPRKERLVWHNLTGYFTIGAMLSIAPIN